MPIRLAYSACLVDMPAPRSTLTFLTQHPPTHVNSACLLVCLFGMLIRYAYSVNHSRQQTRWATSIYIALERMHQRSCFIWRFKDYIGSEFDNTPLGRLSIYEVVRLRWSHGSHTVAFCLSSENARVTYEHGDISHAVHAASTCLCAPLLRPGFCDLVGIDPYRVLQMCLSAGGNHEFPGLHRPRGNQCRQCWPPEAHCVSRSIWCAESLARPSIPSTSGVSIVLKTLWLGLKGGRGRHPRSLFTTTPQRVRGE